MKKIFTILIFLIVAGCFAYAGTNTLNAVVAGQVSDIDDVNQYREALSGDLVPRSSATAAPQDNVSDLGSTTYRWKVGYFAKTILGAISSAISLEENAGDLEFNVGSGGEYAFEINDSEVARVDASGITRSSFPTNGVLRDLKVETFLTTGTFTVPDNVTSVIVWGSGGGGGGGGGGGSYGGGGGGGSGAQPFTAIVSSLTPGANITVTIGAGGAAGAGGATGFDGVVGGNGSNSSFGSYLTFEGGVGGSPGIAGASGASGGAGAPEAMSPMAHLVAGGTGGDGSNGGASTAGSPGDRSIYNLGAGGGSGAGTGSLRGGGGGGGGAGGGAGGTGGVATAGAVGGVGGNGGQSAGGGGGAGGSNNLQGGNGGLGGSGFIQVFYVE